MLSDPQLRAIRAYDVEEAGAGIARPAIIVVDKDGRVAWRYVGENKKDRPTTDMVLERLQPPDAAP